MAATRSAKNPTSGNDTPNTPGVSESAIAAMKVDELRRELRSRGVKGTADLKKPELVKKLIKLETAGAKSTRSGRGKSGSGRKNPTSGNDTPNTPGVSESAIAAMKVDELRRELRSRGVKGTADLKKPELVKKLIKLETAGAKPTTAATTRSAKKSASATTTRSTASTPALIVATPPTTKKSAPAVVDRSTAKKLASAAGKLPKTKKLLFAQTDLPGSNDTPAALEAGEVQGNGSRAKPSRRVRTGKATSNPVTDPQETTTPGKPLQDPDRDLLPE